MGGMTAEDANKIWRQAEKRKAERAGKLPDEQACLDAMFEAYQRLKELGWNDACYCPKDGTVFSVIEAGSTGTFDCHYQGEWPDGSWWTHDKGDLWPSDPILFKPKEKDDAPSDRTRSQILQL